jgi:tetratricopeptide (TPR) repeat protein
MSIKLEREIVGNARDLFKKAKEAVAARNYDYAINLLQTVLKSEPLFLDGRRMLRRAAIDKVRSQKSGIFSIGKGPNIGAMTKLQGIGKKTPQEQLEIAEEILKDDPFNEAANQVIGEAGAALGEPTFKGFAQESIVEGKPNDTKALHKLGRIYFDIKEADKAERVAEKLLALNPADGEAKTLLKDASAMISFSRNYEGKEGDYRQSLHNTQQSIDLEKGRSTVLKDEDILRAIDLAHEKIAKEPKNLNHPKEIARLSAQRGDFASAIQWYTYTFELGGSVDTAIELTINDLKVKQIDKSISDANAIIESSENEEDRAGAQYAKEQWEQYKKQFNLETAQKMVSKYPQDGEYRFQLGKALFENGQFKDALKEFQQSLKQPSVRYIALNLMGQSYMASKMYDFAVDNFAMAEGELVAMDDLKKEIVYNLGTTYELMGEKTKALDQFKKIYKADISYKDVAEKVESSYGR